MNNKEQKALNYDPTDPYKMKLPNGEYCGNCHHIRRCNFIFGHDETDTYCDWSPSRFSKIALRAEQQRAGAKK